jgi:ferric-dicitrate binding protein FerR (iron transport regulator)
MLNPEHVKNLFHRYVSGIASEQEQHELMKLIIDNEGDDTIKQLIAEQLESYDEGHTHTIASIEQSKADQLFQKIMRERQVPSEPEIPRIGMRNAWLKWSAAAAVILLISGLTYQYLKPVNKNQTVASATQPYPYDIPPGKMNAMITLSDGSKINLDSASNGQLALQGNTRISKENGQVKYEYTGGLTDIQFNTVSTARGNQFMVVLPDQTKVWLNASSSITFPTSFTGNTREVKISGEAYFEVAKRKDMPFKVSFAGDGEIEVLGTHFNVNTYKDDGIIRTTLLEGSVRISKNKETEMLAPGQQAQIKENATMHIAEVDTDETIAWKNGFFNFKDADIKAMMQQLSRWYDIDIQYEGPAGKQLFTGEIDRSLNLVSVLKILEKTNVHFRLEENRKLVILP